MHAGSLSSSVSEFQTVGPAIEKARRPSRYDELVSVCRVCSTQTKPRNDIRGCDDMVVKTAALHHDAQLVSDPLWHNDPANEVHCRNRRET